MPTRLGWTKILAAEFADRAHRPIDFIVGLVAAAIVIVTAVMAFGDIPQWEIQTFRTINNLPDWIFPIIWPFMQYGVFATIPVAAAIATYFKKYRLAIMMLAGGLGIYYGARLIKNFVARGRPGDLLSNINARETFAPLSKGYTSGHTAVAGTIATFAYVYLPKRWQIASVVTLFTVLFGRIYIGGHLPLDVFGGVFLGVSVASLLNYIVGVPKDKAPKVKPKKRIRHPGDLVRLGLGGAVFLAVSAMAFGGGVGLLEEYAFRFVNNLPAFISPLIMVIMQAGAVLFVPLVAFTALIFGHARLATKLAIGGFSVWGLTKFAKALVHRDRPLNLFQGVLDRAHTTGVLGFPSGHAAVAAALATIASPYLNKGWSRFVWVIAWTVGFSRVYVGAHLPLDILAGLALGWVMGSILNLIFGTPPRPVPKKQIIDTLEDAGHPIKQLKLANVDGRGSVSLLATTNHGRKLFVKLVNTENRNADWLFKLWRHLTRREVEDEAPFATAKQQIEHEAYVSLAAVAAGVRTKSVILAAPVTRHAAILVSDYVEGTILSQYKAVINDRMLGSIWREVKKLHDNRIAHRDLRAANILVDKKGIVFPFDFGFGENAPSKRQLKIDIVELLTSLSLQVSPRRVVRQAIKSMGMRTIADCLPYLQLPALTSVTRKQARHRPELLEKLHEEIQKQTGAAKPPLVKLTRVNYQSLIWLAAAAATIYVFFPRIGELGSVFDALNKLDPTWLLATLVAASLGYVAATIALFGASNKPLAFGRTLALELATSFINRITPKSAGGIAITERYLEKSGLGRGEAIAAVSLVYGAGILVHAVLLGIALFRSGLNVSFANQPPLLLIGLGILAALGIFMIPRLKRAIVRFAKEGVVYIKDGVRHPKRLLQLLGGSAAVTLSYVFALYASLEAFGSNIPFPEVLLVYLAGSAVAAAAPTPGGLGATEAALAAGLITVGAPTEQAVTGVLTFRLFTFWLPVLPGIAAFRHAQREHQI